MSKTHDRSSSPSSNDRHAPLREDVRLLGQLLGEVLVAQEGAPLFDCVEKVRTLSKAARDGDFEAAQQLHERLQHLDVSESVPVARAFATFLKLANVAEQHHRVRRRNDYRRNPNAAPQRGSLREVFPRLQQAGIAAEEITTLIRRMGVELVFTAHPTEIQRRTLLTRFHAVEQLLEQRDRIRGFSDEECAIEEQLRREITTIWRTDELRHERPTPLDEARSGLLIFEQTLWDALPRVLRSLDKELLEATGTGLPKDAAPIRFGSWMGGDRDGNPNVTAEITRQACHLARWMAAALYEREVEALRRELSLTDGSEELNAAVEGAREPYRALLREVRDRLNRTRHWHVARYNNESPPPGSVYLHADDLRQPLELCWRSLHETGADLVAQGRLLDLLRRLSTFGLTLVRLDLRQDRARHTAAMDAITKHQGLGSYAEWDESTRRRFLIEALERDSSERLRQQPSTTLALPTDLVLEPEPREVLDTMQVIANEPAASLGVYIISMASQTSDVLAVEYLQRAAGVVEPLPVVPLFETEADLTRSPEAVRDLLESSGFRDRNGNQLQIMLGYSDSAKDVGRLAASWALYRAQEQMVEVCRDRDVELVLFHGRGGTIGRGGGPTHAAILSQPPGSVNGRLRVTEQGEMIQAKFGIPGIAERTLELSVTAILEATLTPPKLPADSWRNVMDDLAQRSRDAFRNVVRGEPDFVRYFRTVTPEPELGLLHMGSRPARRGGGNEAGIESLRAIPWVFAWMQTRLLLPAWLGVGEALQGVLESQQRETLQAMSRGWPFLRSTLDLIAMVLAKAEPSITEYYERTLAPDDLHPLGHRLRERCRLARASLLECTGKSDLLDDHPVLEHSIATRNPYVDPINLVQAELLCRVRHRNETELVNALVVTVNGVAAGMRNTG